MGDTVTDLPVSEVKVPATCKAAVTLGQACWSLMFVAMYVAAAVGGLLTLGITGAIGPTLDVLLPAPLTAMTAAVYLALYVHLFRRNKLTLADVGFRRPTRRMFHLLWQSASAEMVWPVPVRSPIETSATQPRIPAPASVAVVPGRRTDAVCSGTRALKSRLGGASGSSVLSVEDLPGMLKACVRDRGFSSSRAAQEFLGEGTAAQAVAHRVVEGPFRAAAFGHG